MPVVVGTAGHIDHGKTSLVRALTGQDTDRLKEEKARGISIDLGFAYLDVGGERAGIVDVPGHERFIRNMLAGAHGMDLVLFTVAADDGVMPQTEEHLDILHLLGVGRGVFVITKTDLVEPARVSAVRDEIEILAAGTTLEGAPIVPVSTATGDGLDALRSEIARQLSGAAPGATSSGPFRLPVDRAFVMHGHGVVVTGTAVAGRVREGDAVQVFPGGERARVRSLEVHGAAVAEAGAGQRVAMNLAGVERSDIARGHVVCGEGFVGPTTRLDVFVEVRPGARRPLASHGRIRVHVGTAEMLAKLVVLDERAAVAPGERGWAQLVLAEPVLAVRGDRFILRDETARWTLGGGVVVNPFADRHRRDEPGLVERLTALRDGDVETAARTLLVSAPELACERGAIARALGVAAGDVDRALAGTDAVVPIPDAGAPEAYALAEPWVRLEAEVVRTVADAHRAHPAEAGFGVERLRAALATSLSSRTVQRCVDHLVRSGRLARTDGLVHAPAHRAGLDADARALAAGLEQALTEAGFTPPDLRQLEAALQVERRRIVEVLGVLERERRVVRVAPDLYYASRAADDAKALLAEHCRAHGEISAAVFRDLIGASRKFAIALLDWFDRTGVTTRVGDMRRLRR
jgi:selenocysteine-specific elongation factor